MPIAEHTSSRQGGWWELRFIVFSLFAANPLPLLTLRAPSARDLHTQGAFQTPCLTK